MIDHSLVFTGKAGERHIADVFDETYAVSQAAVSIRYYQSTVDYTAVIRISADAAERMDLVKVICIHRVTAHVAPDCRYRHLPGFVGHNAESAAVSVF